MIKHILDFHENVDYNILQGRDVVFFDMNIWIDIADVKSILAKDVRYLLSFLVKDKKIFCPLYSSILSELYFQSTSSMMRVSEIMEELSLNFCFVNYEEIWQNEIKLFIQSLLDKELKKLNIKNIFIPFVGYLSSKGILKYPIETNEEDANKITKVIKSNLGLVTISNLVATGISKANSSKEIYSKQLNKGYKEVWANNKGDKRKIRIENQNYIANTKILPAIRKINKTLKPEEVFRITKYITSLPKDSYKSAFNSIIDFMPSLRNDVEILSIVPLDNQRNFTINDHYDIENLIVPLAYSDVFVSKDKWIRHLLKVTDLPQKNNCIYLYDLNDLIKYLSKEYLLN